MGSGDQESQEEECVRRTKLGQTYTVDGKTMQCNIYLLLRESV